MDYQQQAQNQTRAYLGLLQSEAWAYIKEYYKDQVESLTKRYLSGDEIKESERHQVIGLVKLITHIEESAKKIINDGKGN